MLFGILTIVYYIFILVSYFSSEHVCEIFHENRKIKFALLSGCLTFMNRVKKKKNRKKQQIKKLAKLSITPFI